MSSRQLWLARNCPLSGKKFTNNMKSRKGLFVRGATRTTSPYKYISFKTNTLCNGYILRVNSLTKSILDYIAFTTRLFDG